MPAEDTEAERLMVTFTVTSADNDFYRQWPLSNKIQWNPNKHTGQPFLYTIACHCNNIVTCPHKSNSSSLVGRLLCNESLAECPQGSCGVRTSCLQWWHGRLEATEVKTTDTSCRGVACHKDHACRCLTLQHNKCTRLDKTDTGLHREGSMPHAIPIRYIHSCLIQSC